MSSDLQNKAKALSVYAEWVASSKTHKGWDGKRKILLHVLWERVFIDESKLKKSKLKLLDDYKDIAPETSLVQCLRNAMISYCNSWYVNNTEVKASTNVK